jgi:hypothetical protein
MDEQKSFVLEIAEAIDRRLRRRPSRDKESLDGKRGWRWLGRQMIPNIGTVLVVVILLLTVPSLAAPSQSPSATSTSTISYQGRLADSAGNPLTDKYNMEFRLYDVPTGGVPLWTEMWTGANAVDVSDGLFNVMLGSIDNTLASSIEGYDELYLGITVGTDSEMVPRVQLGSVPFSMQAMTVQDGSITTGKIADGAVTQAKLGSDVSLEPPEGSITTTMIADGAVTSSKFKPLYLEDYQPSEVTQSDSWDTLHDGGVVVTGTAEVDSYAIVVFSAIAWNENNTTGAGIGIAVNGTHYGLNDAYKRQPVGGIYYQAPITIQRVVPVPAGDFEIRGMIHRTDGGIAHFINRRLSVVLVSQ